MNPSSTEDLNSAVLYQRPMVPLVIALMAGIVLGGAVSGYRPLAWGGVGAVTMLLMGYVRRRKDAVFSLVLVAALGYLSIQPVLDPRLPRNHLIRFAGEIPFRITGVVCDLPVKRSYRQVFIMRVERIGQGPAVDQPAVGRLRVTATGSIPPSRPGDRIHFSARIRGLKNFNNPDRFDYVRYMACRQVRVSAYVRGDLIRITAPAAGHGLWIPIHRFRQEMASWIDRHAATDLGAGILRALLVGDRSGIPPDLRNAFSRTGIGHLLAISGLHIGIIAAVAFFVFKKILSFSSLFLHRGWVRKGAALLAMIPVIGYGLVAGMSPSTQRAVLMVLVFLLATLADRDQESINTLAFAALVLLMMDPGALFSISFQLSFTAVAVILYGLNRIARGEIRPQGVARRLLTKLVLFMAVSFLATVGTLPLTLYYFNMVSTVGMVSNLLAVPLIGTIAVPLGLLGLCLIPFCESAAAMLLSFSEIFVSVVTRAVQHVDGQAMVAVDMFTPTVFEIFIYYSVVWAVINLQRTKSARVMLLILLFISGANACYWIQQRLWHRDFRVTVIDVGQGSASLLEFPKGRCMLIDGGGFSDNTGFDVGRYVVGPLLRKKRILTVDTVVLSHPNSDHMNGLLFILAHFKVGEVWTNGQRAATAGYHRFADIIYEQGIPSPGFDDISRHANREGVQVDILHPARGFLTDAGRRSRRNTNNNSIVVKTTFGSTGFLFPGDIMAAAERELVACHGSGLRSTFVTAPHHGSRTSSTERFLKAVKPEWVIFSSGRKGSRLFPHPTVLDRYRSHGARMLRTDTHGAVSISIDAEGYSLSTFLPMTADPG